MAKRTCSKGHIYDSSIYGDQCPFCPSERSSDESKTRVADGGNENDGHTMVMPDNEVGGTMPMGEMPKNDETIPMWESGHAGGTMIRPVGGVDSGSPRSLRRIAGILATYDPDPNGTIYNIYEGRNYIGRDSSCDIVIPKDTLISGRHTSILYRSVDNKFKFRDEQSSNGTFINNQIMDDGELQNGDVITVGNTRLVFLVIPKF